LTRPAAMVPVMVRPADAAGPALDDHDFSAVFRDGGWLVQWKWRDNVGPRKNLRRVTYTIAECNQEAFDTEIETWIEDGILVKHNRAVHGDIQRFCL
jgi:hypothetical protein